MIFVPIPRDRIEAEWPRITDMLGKAFVLDADGATPEDVNGWLLSGRSEAFWVGVTVNATGLAITTTETSPVDGTEVCWINYVGGTVRGGPRAFVRTAREVVDLIEQMARKQGCTQLRGGGRDWSRVFPEWEHYDPEHPNRMRKVIS